MLNITIYIKFIPTNQYNQSDIITLINIKYCLILYFAKAKYRNKLLEFSFKRSFSSKISWFS